MRSVSGEFAEPSRFSTAFERTSGFAEFNLNLVNQAIQQTEPVAIWLPTFSTPLLGNPLPDDLRLSFQRIKLPRIVSPFQLSSFFSDSPCQSAVLSCPVSVQRCIPILDAVQTRVAILMLDVFQYCPLTPERAGYTNRQNCG